MRLVVGIGNRYRGDDAAGPLVAEVVAARHLPGVTAIECDGDPLRLLDRWAGADIAVVVDAAVVAEPRPGRWRRTEYVDLPPASASSHGLGLPEAVELGRLLDRLPALLVVYAVEAADTRLGADLSPGVRAAVDPLADIVAAEVSR
ncbi:MAG: hydrogenase maturation protease [Mycobacteriales bacterium]|jgi:hydrogenase maturation protease